MYQEKVYQMQLSAAYNANRGEATQWEPKGKAVRVRIPGTCAWSPCEGSPRPASEIRHVGGGCVSRAMVSARVLTAAGKHKAPRILAVAMAAFAE